jgi:predicted SprT family Zn-dependent metalloprotease
MSGKLAAATTSTGGIKLIWSTKLRTAAGRAHWTRVKRPLGGQGQHDLKIELSTRIITSEEKMRDTLAHELCHCATWVIDDNPNANHGKQFKEWYHLLSFFQVNVGRGSRITHAFPDIEVTTKHAYEIEYKFMYTCSNASCGLDFGRQKKIDLNRLVCGACKSRLFQTKGSTGKENRANPFGEFVRGNFADVKRENPGSVHKEIMGVLSRMYKEGKEKRAEAEGIEEVVGGVAVIDLT